jgi:predicted nucleic acid-binding protein
MYLLDTNVVSELRKARAGKADRNVTAWATPIPLTQLFISVVTIHELEMGVGILGKGSCCEHGWIGRW